MTAAEPYGVAYVTVLADLDKFEGDLSKKMQKGVDAAGKSQKFTEFDKAATKAAKQTGEHMEKGIEQGIDSRKGELKKAGERHGSTFAGSFMATVRRIVLSRGGLYGALGAAAAGVLGAGQSLLPAALATLPSIATAAAGGIATLVFALHGFMGAIGAGVTGDTEAFNAALAKLAPSARSVVKEIVGLTGVFTQLQQQIQQQFFAPLQGSFAQLARSLLPILRAQLPELAKTFGQLGQSFLAGFSYFGSGSAIGTILKQLDAGLRPFIPLLAQAVNLFLRVGAVAAPFLTKLSELAAGKFSDFLVKLDASLGNGGVLKFFSEAGDFLVSLGGALGPILGLLGDVLGAFAQFGSPTLALIGTLANTLRTALGPALGPLAKLLGTIVTGAGKLLTALTPGLTAIFQVLGSFLDAVSGNLPALFAALSPLLTDISAVLVAAAPSLSTMFADLANTIFPALVQILQDLAPLWAQMTPFWVQFAEEVLPQLVPLFKDTLGIFVALLPLLPPIVNLFITWVPVLMDMLPLISDFAKLTDWWLRNFVIPMLGFWVGLIGGFINLLAQFDKLAVAWGWKPVLEGFKSAIDKIVSAIKTAISWYDRLTGKVFSGQAQAAFDGVSKNTAPKYASGGLVTSPTLAMVGEGGDPEAIVPMGSRDQARRVAQQTGLLSMLGTRETGGWSGSVHVYLGTREITDIVDVIVDDKLDDTAAGLDDGTRG